MRKVATIVETRVHPALGFVVDNFMSILPKEWEFQIFHTDDYVRRQLVRDLPIRHGRKIHWDKIPDVPYTRTMHDYSILLLSNDFWEKCHGDLILMFQTDTMLCKDSKYKISDFEHYDYIGGVPAAGTKNGNLARAGEPPFMNGGLSLRRNQAMLDVPKPTLKLNLKLKSGGIEPEDRFYSRAFMHHPDLGRDSKRFSWDHGYVDEDIPFGLHKPWLGPATRRLFSKLIPETDRLRRLCKKS